VTVREPAFGVPGRDFALGVEEELLTLERVLADGAGADRQRAAYTRGGMRAVLEHLAAETAAEL
jgi:carboxylate-amine ligase